jgi:hypothetical protein
MIGKKLLALGGILAVLGIGGYALHHRFVPYPALGPHDLTPFLEAEKVELFSLERSSRRPGPNYGRNDAGWFNGFRIVGMIELAHGADRITILEALQDSLNKAPRSPAACFFPEHGVRIVHDSKITDYVLCFHCMNYELYENGKELGGVISDSALNVFDEFLVARSVPLAPKGRPKDD